MTNFHPMNYISWPSRFAFCMLVIHVCVFSKKMCEFNRVIISVNKLKKYICKYLFVQNTGFFSITDPSLIKEDSNLVHVLNSYNHIIIHRFAFTNNRMCCLLCSDFLHNKRVMLTIRNGTQSFYILGFVLYYFCSYVNCITA